MRTPGCAELLSRLSRTRRLAGEKSVWVTGLRRADVNEFIDVIVAPRQTQESAQESSRPPKPIFSPSGFAVTIKLAPFRPRRHP